MSHRIGRAINEKIVSIVSIVFKTFAARMAGGSGDKHNLLSCVVLKTIETIETILKKQYFFILALSFQKQHLFRTELSLCLFRKNVIFPKISVCFTTARACALWA